MARNPRSRTLASPAAVPALVAALLVSVPPTIAQQRVGPTPIDDRAIVHTLNRVTFGPRPGDVERVKAMGLLAFVEQQLHPGDIDDRVVEARLRDFETLDTSTRELADRFFIPAMEQRRARVAAAPRNPQSVPNEMAAAETPTAGRAAASPEARAALAGPQLVVGELTEARLLRAALSERQLQEVLVDFWFNHFNVFVGKGQVRQYLTEYERDAIRPHVFGSFRELLGAVAHSPAMLFYLDNWQSATPDARPAVRPAIGQRLRDPRLSPADRARIEQRVAAQQMVRPRQASGLNENYARELMELHTLGVDGGYTQQDVVELARILTGWTIDRPQQGGAFVFRPAMHDTGTKTLLGVTFAASGQSEGERALDLLARHPSTARHLARKLAQRFVADDPPPSLVERTARTFLDTKGDLRQVVRAVITSPEFFAADVRRAKIKTPLEFVISAVRATGATIADAQPLAVALRNLGMPLYGCQPPTGYSMTADAWVNTGALINRMNFAVGLVGGGRIVAEARIARAAGAADRGPARAAGPGRGPRSVARSPLRIDLPALAPDTGAASRAALIGGVLAGEASDATRATLDRAESPSHLVALVLGSPEFQRR
jgi:uncharacterized protein (DUF1800 family)